MPNNALFSIFAPIYDRVFANHTDEKLRELLQLKREHRLLDVGGGTGRVSAPMRGEVKELFLGDYSFAMLREAKKKNLLAPLQLSSLHLPFQNDSFDRILVVDALHHFPEQQTAARELLRVLKVGGRLVIEEPNIHHFGVKIVALMEKLALMGSYFHTPNEIQAMLQSEAVHASVHLPPGPSAWIVAEK